MVAHRIALNSSFGARSFRTEKGFDMKRLLLVFITVLFLHGCASSLKLDPYALDGQKEIYQEGVESIISPKKSLVAIRPAESIYSSGNRPKIVITVLNGTDEPFNFSTENVQVFVDDNPHKVFTYDELVAEVKRQQAFGAFMAALNGISQSMNAANAGHAYSSGSINTYAYDNYGNSVYGYGTYTEHTYDPMAVQQAQAAASAQTIAYMQLVNNQAEQSLSSLKTMMLKKTTVFPQAWHGGYVAMEKIPDISQNHTIKVVVSILDEKHTFLLNQLKIDN